MLELFDHPEHVERWERALDGRLIDWDEISPVSRNRRLGRCDVLRRACERLPGRHRPALRARPRRLVAELSRHRRRDARLRPLRSLRSSLGGDGEAEALAVRFAERLSPDWDDERAAKLAYVRHNEAVRAAIPPDRLVEWRPGDGWDPSAKPWDCPCLAHRFRISTPRPISGPCPGSARQVSVDGWASGPVSCRSRDGSSSRPTSDFISAAASSASSWRLLHLPGVALHVQPPPPPGPAPRVRLHEGGVAARLGPPSASFQSPGIVWAGESFPSHFSATRMCAAIHPSTSPINSRE